MLQKPSFFLFLIIVAVLTAPIPAEAVKLTVKRVVFEREKRAEVITVINSSNREITYRVGWRHFVMTRDRALNAVPESELPDSVKPAADFIRYAPRRFTLAPKTSQQIRLILRMNSDVADGEYRSHLWIRPEEEVERLKFREELKQRNKSGSKTSGVSMRMLSGVTMPVIIRKGSLSAEVDVSNLSAKQTPGFIDVSHSLLRSGDRSVYGSLEYICNQGAGGAYSIRSVKGIAVYPEVNQRDFSARIPKPEGESACQTLSVEYYEVNKFRGNANELLGQQTVNVQ